MMSRAVRNSAARRTSDGFAGFMVSTTLNSPLGCSTDTVLAIARRHHGITIRNAARHDRGGRHRDGAQHAHGRVTVVRNEGPGADMPSRSRFGHQAHLRHDLLEHVAQIHRGPRLEANRLDLLLERGIGVQLVAGFVAGHAQ